MTDVNTIYRYGKQSYRKEGDFEYVTLPLPVLWDITILDTPGFNANEKDSRVAALALGEVDLAVVLIQNKGISESAVRTIGEIHKRCIPYFVIMNCYLQRPSVATWNPESKFNFSIQADNANRLKALGYSPLKIRGNSVFSINLAWYWYTSKLYQSDLSPSAQQTLEEIQDYERKKGRILPQDSRFCELRQCLMSNSLRRKVQQHTTQKLLISKLRDDCNEIFSIHMSERDYRMKQGYFSGC